ncbi:MAG: neutral/alkaline non-lysosomal ceramidase N-terminal domain-containing protein [Acidobacteria bacterium]|nr:neutral/alkaline non-lysosomal ceramidase N-terminal domain-containing protein [Acidobacteriota bacterium]
MRFLLALALAPLTFGAAFRAAVVKVDITPATPQWLLGYAARQSTGVHDKIYHRVVLVDDGRTQFALVSSDICLISPAEYEKVAAALEKRTGIKPVNFWWSFTHTHSAPEVGPPGLALAFLGDRYTHKVETAYTEMVEAALIDAVAEAREKLQPAKLGAAWGTANANINRRARDVEGETFLGLNPDGPVDRRLGLIRIDKADGAPLVLLANYPIHGTVLGGQNLLITGDAPGVVSEYVEQKTGAPLLFLNGAAGDQAPIYTTQPTFQAGRLSQFRVLLGDRILETNRQLKTTSANVTLSTAADVVETPRRAGLTFPAELASYAPGQNVRLPVRFLKINKDIAVWSAPIELFCEIAMRIRDRSKIKNTFYFGYTNGWLGYLLTPKELKLGGYEPRVSPYTAQAADDLTNAVLKHLGRN